MNSTFLDLILGQSYLHVISYGLVIAILFVAVKDAFVLRQLKRALAAEHAMLKQGGLTAFQLEAMLHPVASSMGKLRGSIAQCGPSTLQRKVDVTEAALFVPLRARMSLTRDLSTLMGLIATLLALVAAASDFARHGKPELLIGSVGTGCVATCVAAIGCAIALWNLSRLTRLRLAVACDCEDVLLEMGQANGPELVSEWSVPIHQATAVRTAHLNALPEANHAAL